MTNAATCIQFSASNRFELEISHRNRRYAMLVSFVKTLMFFDDWNSPCARRKEQHLRRLWLQITSQYKRLNCSCGTRDEVKLTVHDTRFGNVQTSRSRSICWRSVASNTTTSGLHIFSNTTFLYGRNFTNKWILAGGLFYSKFCVYTKCVLRFCLCSTSTTATSEYGITLMLSANVAVEPASAPEFQRASSGALQWHPAATRQVDWTVMECYGDGSAGAA
jgi:hypothetical protein